MQNNVVRKFIAKDQLVLDISALLDNQKVCSIDNGSKSQGVWATAPQCPT